MNDQLRKKLDGRLVVASISGGKDSAAMGLWLMEQGVPFIPVFLDTGWEHPLTYEYIREDLTAVFGPIEERRGPETFEELVIRKGMFPSQLRRFCTEELKVKVMQTYLAELLNGGADVVNAVGIRRAESDARADSKLWEWSNFYDCEIWRPLVDFSEADVIDIHRRHGLRPNPLYLLGASRVGCWPCIHARKAEIKLIADTDPERIERIRVLEKKVGDAALERMERKGETERKHPLPTFFQYPVRDPETGERPCRPIDDIVAWSRTRHGGREPERQLDMMAPFRGCMRWGLCE